MADPDVQGRRSAGLAEILAQPWILTEQAYRTLIAAPTAFFRFYDEEEVCDDLDVRDGVAVIPVRGVLYNSSSYWANPAASYTRILGRFIAAIERADVAAIVLDVASPGGQVDGCYGVAAAIFAARGVKPIVACATGQCASGAYWIASAADRIHATPMSMLGSIGVVSTFYDYSKMDEELGIKEIKFVSSQSPNKQLDPKGAAGRDYYQALVDKLAGVFVESVALHRGVDEQTVITQYGAGGVLVGDDAVRAGLADGIATLDEIVSQLAVGGLNGGTAT